MVDSSRNTGQHSRCENCDGALNSSDRYGAACGQQVRGADARSFRHLLLASAAEVSSLDGRLWRSLRLLLLSPGELSRQHRLGRRQRYLSPISPSTCS